MPPQICILLCMFTLGPQAAPVGRSNLRAFTSGSTHTSKFGIGQYELILRLLWWRELSKDKVTIQRPSNQASEPISEMEVIIGSSICEGTLGFHKQYHTHV